VRERTPAVSATRELTLIEPEAVKLVGGGDAAGEPGGLNALFDVLPGVVMEEGPAEGGHD